MAQDFDPRDEEQQKHFDLAKQHAEATGKKTGAASGTVKKEEKEKA